MVVKIRVQVDCCQNKLNSYNISSLTERNITFLETSPTINTSYSTMNITQGKPNIIIGRYKGTQQRYLISGPLYCVLYDSWKRLECTVRHVFLRRVSLWIENEPITNTHDSCTLWLSPPASPYLCCSSKAGRWETMGTRLSWPIFFERNRFLLYSNNLFSFSCNYWK